MLFCSHCGSAALMFSGNHVLARAMGKDRIHHFRRFMGALAILSALMNAWILMVHTRSVLVAQLGTRGDGVIICHQGSHDGDAPAQPRKKSPENECPICSGLSSLHLAMTGEPLVLPGPSSHRIVVRVAYATQVADHRPRQTLNRGPPLVS